MLFVEEADVAVETYLAVDDAVVCRLVNHFAGGWVDGKQEVLFQFGEFVERRLFVLAVIHVAHRAVLVLVLKHYPVAHNGSVLL